MRETKEEVIVIEQIDNCLPQIHCQKCGFFSCLPYAKAIVKKRLTFTSVSQAGSKVVQKLGEITGEKCQSQY